MVALHAAMLMSYSSQASLASHALSPDNVTPSIGTCAHLGGVSGDEVVHGLLGGQAGHGGQHTEGVAAQQDEVLGVAAHAGHLGIVDVVDGVAGAGVLCDGAAWASMGCQRGRGQPSRCEHMQQTIIMCQGCSASLHTEQAEHVIGAPPAHLDARPQRCAGLTCCQSPPRGCSRRTPRSPAPRRSGWPSRSRARSAS